MKCNSKPPVVYQKFGGGYNIFRWNSMAVPAKTEDDVIVINGIPVPWFGDTGSSASGSIITNRRPTSTSSSSCRGGGSDHSKFKSEVYESYRTLREKYIPVTWYKLTGSNYGPMKLGCMTQFKAESPLEISPSIPTRMGFPNFLKYWSPEDDGIQVILPCSSTTVSTDQKKISSREDVDAYMTKALYGNTNSGKKRLPVFQEIC